MNWGSFLFGFGGRLNRGKYWLAVLIYFVAWVVFLIGALTSLGGATVDNIFRLAGAGLAIWAVGLALFVAGAWSGIAVGIKRLHDREKSGWWLLLFWLGPSVLSGAGISAPDAAGIVLSLAALAVTVWGFVELGCLRGTAGPNAYGPDPIGVKLV